MTQITRKKNRHTSKLDDDWYKEKVRVLNT